MRRCVVGIVALSALGGCGSARPASERSAAPSSNGASTPASGASAGPRPSPGLGGMCHDGWCWEDPLPTGDDVVAVAALGNGRALVAVDTPKGTTILDTDGRSFAHAEISRQITALARVARDDVWGATREGLLEHFDGARWTDVDARQTRPLAGIWAASARDVWAVGAGGAILHGDGARFSPVPSPTTSDLWGVRGRNARDVWAVGDGVVLHFDGTKWSIAHRVDRGPMQRPIPRGGFCGTPALLASAYNASLAAMRTVLPLSAGDVWIAGGPGRALHFDGGRWREADLHLVAVHAGWVASSRDAWAVGSGWMAHWNGKKWVRGERRPIDERLAAIDGASPRDVWAVGMLGTILHFDGTTWTHVDEGSHARINGVWVGPGGAAWAAGEDGVVLRRTKTGWERVPLPDGYARANVNTIGGANESDLWAFVAFHAPLHWDGRAFAPFGTKALLAFHLRAPAANDVWAIGALSLARWDGRAWTDLSGGPYLVQDLWAPSKGVAWAIGRPVDPHGRPSPALRGMPAYDFSHEVLLRWDGSKFVEVAPLPDGDVSGIGGVGDRPWVADSSRVWRWNGRAFEVAYDPHEHLPPNTFVHRERRVDARSARDVFVSGQGDVVHFDGVSWNVEPPPVPNASLAVGPTDVFAYGYYGGILHRERRARVK